MSQTTGRGKVKAFQIKRKFEKGTRVSVIAPDFSFLGAYVSRKMQAVKGQTGSVEAFRPTKFKAIGIKMDSNGLLLWCDEKELKAIKGINDTEVSATDGY